MYGRKATLPTSIYDKKDQEINYDNYACEMRKCFAKMHSIAKDNLILSKQKRKELYDRSATNWIPMWGDLVMLQNNPTGKGRKIQPNFSGPYEIVSLPSEQTAIIKINSRLERVHLNRLRKFND